MRFVLLILVSGQLLLFALDVRERFFSARKRYAKGVLRRRTIGFIVVVAVAYGTLQLLGMQLVPEIDELIVASGLLLQSDAAPIAAEPGNATFLLLVIVGFYVLGLCDYLVHRFLSHNRFFWFTHESHHLVSDVSTFMPGILVRPYAFFVYLPSAFVAILAMQALLTVLGFGAYDMSPIILAVFLLQMTVLGMSHSSCLRRCDWLHRALRPLGITSPQEHWLHHCRELQCNYGNSVILWDRIFGTYREPRHGDATAYNAGLDYPQDFLGAISGSKLSLPEHVRRRFQMNLFCCEALSSSDVEQRREQFEEAPVSRT